MWHLVARVDSRIVTSIAHSVKAHVEQQLNGIYGVGDWMIEEDRQRRAINILVREEALLQRIPPDKMYTLNIGDYWVALQPPMTVFVHAAPPAAPSVSTNRSKTLLLI